MKKAVALVAGIGLLAVIGGTVFLAASPLPAPAAHIEKPVADDKMPR